LVAKKQKMVNYEDNPKSIKFHVKQFILSNQERLKGKVVVDLPAGNGVTSSLLQKVGCDVRPFDLFPEYFEVEGLICERANVMDKIPLESNEADVVICQEGIEHFSDQFRALREFNRVTIKGGSLIITTPNYSNLRSRMSYFLSESERFNSIMPPNEIDSVWMNNPSVTNEIYFGHVFLIGIQKLRVLARLSGYRIKHIQPTRAKSTSVLLYFLHFPWIWLSNYITYKKNLKKDKGYSKAYQQEVYREIFKLSIHKTILTHGHLFIELEKIEEADDVMKGLKSVHKDFSTRT
jgi:SAM-dependent methyltransferase